jgi:copper(I)-binding protein
LQIEGAWARPAQAGDATAVYLTIVNTGDTADALVAVHFDGAEMAGIHETRMEGDVMQMRPVASLEIPAGGTVELKPGGYHIMLTNLKHDLTAGEHATLTLEFEHSGQVAIEAEVVAP